MKILFGALLIVFQVWKGSAMPDNNFTFTYNMALRCKEHLSQHGYSYDTFYRVNAEDRRQKNGAGFEMHIGILAASNGHILLSTLPHPDSSDPVYEIVVGGGGNKFTELRRNLRRNARASAKTVGILSPIEFRAFYIRISEDGDIEFGREGDALPLLSYTDVDPLSVRYFSFASWNGVEAKFLYDCPAPGDDGSENTPDSEEVEPKLSNSEQLKRTILLGRLPNFPPSPVVNVAIGVKAYSLNYNAYTSKLTIGLSVVTSWTDDSMAWNPAKFNGTTALTFRQGQIWRPTFFVFNSNDMGVMDTISSELITVVNSGEATFHFKTKVNTWCFDVLGTSAWPHDGYTCPVLIGAWEAHEKFTLEELSPKDEKMREFTVIENIVRNEWDIKAEKSIITATDWNDEVQQLDNQTHQSDKLMLYFHLNRRATTHNIVFYTPLLVLMSFILMSFGSEPLQMTRVWFYACASIIICGGLCYIDFLVPCHTVPSIIILYTTVLMGVLLALLTQILLRTSVAEKVCKSVPMQTILTSKWVRLIFCLPAMKTCTNYESINQGFAQEDDDSVLASSSRNGSIEEMQAEATTYGERRELANVIDKAMLFTYSILFAIMLALHY